MPSLDPIPNLHSEQSAPDALECTHSAWQRMSIWALLPIILQSLWQYWGLWLGGGYFWLRKEVDYRTYLPVIAGLLLLFIAHAIARWWTTQFRSIENGVELKQGIWHQSLLKLPQQRIHELQVRQNLLLKVLNLYSISLDSAGAKKPELELSAINPLQLQWLTGQRTEPQASHHDTPFYRIWLSVCYRPEFWLSLLAISGSLYTQVGKEGRQQVKLWVQQLLSYLDVAHSSHWQWLGWFALSSAVVAAFFACLVWLMFYPQLFDAKQGLLQLQRGTVLQRTTKIRAALLQRMQVRQPFIARLLGHYSLTMFGMAHASERHKFVLLGLKHSSLSAVLTSMPQGGWLSLAALAALPKQPFASAYFRRRFSYQALLISAGTLLLVWADPTHWPWYLTLGGLLTVYVAVDTAIYQRHHGYWLCGQQLYLWRGGLSQRWDLLSLAQVQQVKMVQSRFLRRRQLVAVHFLTANGSVKLPAIPLRDAQQLYQQVLQAR